MIGTSHDTTVPCPNCGEPVERVHTSHGIFDCRPGLVSARSVRMAEIVVMEGGTVTIIDRMNAQGRCRLPHNCPEPACLGEKPGCCTEWYEAKPGQWRCKRCDKVPMELTSCCAAPYVGGDEGRAMCWKCKGRA